MNWNYCDVSIIIETLDAKHSTCSYNVNLNVASMKSADKICWYLAAVCGVSVCAILGMILCVTKLSTACVNTCMVEYEVCVGRNTICHYQNVTILYLPSS